MDIKWLQSALMYPIESLTVPNETDRVNLTKPPAGVMHTVEGNFDAGLAVFKVHFAPHFLVGDSRVAQLVPLGTIAAALEHPPGGVETNRWARVQIEVAGSSKLESWKPEHPIFDRLASLVAVLESVAGIPLRRPWPDQLDPATTWAAANNPRRLHSKWGSESGWFGHVEIPGNSHWDPGSLQYGALFERARELRIDFLAFQLEQFLKRHGIIPRAVWGARAATMPRIPVNLDGAYNAIVIHHSGRRGRTDPKAIQALHMDKNHWSDVGFHFMIGPGGEIYEGRSLLFKGAHVKNANTDKIGVLVMGDFEREFLGLLGREPSGAQLAAVTRLGRGLKQLFPGITTLGGHKDYDKGTVCPGNKLAAHMRELRVAMNLGGPAPLTSQLQ